MLARFAHAASSLRSRRSRLASLTTLLQARIARLLARLLDRATGSLARAAADSQRSKMLARFAQAAGSRRGLAPLSSLVSFARFAGSLRSQLARFAGSWLALLAASSQR